MKSLFYSLIFLLCLIANSGNASIMKCSIASEQNEIIFVDSSQIHFSNHQVLVNLNDKMVPLTNLCGDYQGVFIEYNLGIQGAYWVCPRCNLKSPLWSLPYCDNPPCEYVCTFIPH
ncbi:MAG: hypothetical protein H0T62_07030 [Parachlamydiaceae bacterium]|nr:hypothetical protein [Parachlamydiaceae bacterium]